jgi:hypothetical protein
VTVILELSDSEAQAVSIALNALIWDKPTREISPRWCEDAEVVQDRLLALRDTSENPA